MNMTTTIPPPYYASHGEMTDPKAHLALLERLPTDVAGLCEIVQGLLIHDYFGLHLYGPPPPDHDLASRETLPASERLAAILAAQNEPISTPRPAFERTVGTCRDLSLMLCALLRHHAVPARVRCGFAKYFHPPSYEDHWICEYWKAAEQRWAMADAQLDEAHRKHLSIDFDTTDVPEDQFIFPWQAWRLCRSGAAEAAQFGHGDAVGEWFLQVNLARDLLSLCKREVSTWDSWRDALARSGNLDDEAVLRCDQFAALAQAARGLSPPDLKANEIQGFLSPPWQS